MQILIVKLTLSITFIFCSCGLVQSQSPQPSANDPTLVRQSGFSVQPAPNYQNSSQPIMQANGQRVYAQPPANNSNANGLERVAPTTAKSSVQSASWSTPISTETSNSTTIKSKSRVPLELKGSTKENSTSFDKPTSSWGATLSMFLSLIIVISFFLLIVWLIKKSQPHSFVKLPGDVVQVMGRTPMAPRQQMYVVRFGSKLLLISHQPGQTQTLGEITNEDEVQRLAGLCEANQPGSISNSFRDVLKQVALGKSEPHPRTQPSLDRRARS